MRYNYYGTSATLQFYNINFQTADLRIYNIYTYIGYVNRL